MEKNKNILKKAIKRLPEYSPDDKNWSDISSQLEKKAGSSKIPELNSFEPPQKIWDNIDRELSRREKSSSLSQYDPPDLIWENIQNNLPAEDPNRNRKRVIQLFVWSSAIAALLILGYFIFINEVNQTQFTYSEEFIEVQELETWQNEEQAIDQALISICEAKPTACTSSEFKMMEEDLTFLNQSKEAILKQLSKYDSNTELEIMLTEIELERTKLIKEMINKII